MKSMTGFGRATLSNDLLDASIDVSSVNRKGLEISCALPRDWLAAERNVAQRVKEFYTRGKVSVAIRVNFKSLKGGAFSNSEQIRMALESLKNSCEEMSIDFKPSISDLIAIAKSIEGAEALPDFEELWEDFDKNLQKALLDADKMRLSEGANLKRDFEKRLQTLANFVTTIEEESKGTVADYKEQLLNRLKALDIDLDLDDERVLKEVSIFADKADICEEITRLKSHIGQFESCINSTENCGRKLDFICQEMGREINTIGSKANKLAISKLVIDFKNELERVREQVQNVE